MYGDGGVVAGCVEVVDVKVLLEYPDLFLRGRNLRVEWDLGV